MAVTNLDGLVQKRPLVVTIRTANRAPKRNYVGQTVRALLSTGLDPNLLHIFPTGCDVGWLLHELPDLPIVVHLPARHYNPNENGIRQVAALDRVDAEWILMLEDDLEFCADAIGSMTRWLGDHAWPNVAVYRFFALPGTPIRGSAPFVGECPLREMRGSQAVALRADDARAFAAWASAHPTDWRPKNAPFQDRPDRGFDKLIGYWALQHNPKQLHGLISRPMMVRHVGTESALYSRGLKNDHEFAGKDWSYRQESFA